MFDKYHVPIVTALWMVTLPLVVWFFAGAGSGTVFNALAQFLSTLFSIYGGSSLFFGFLLLIWTCIQAMRDRSLAQQEQARG